MQKILFFATLLFFLHPVVHSSGFSSKGQDCAKCHTLKKEEATAILKEIIPNAKVLAVRAFPFRAVWEIDIESDGKKLPVYLDLSKNFLISGSLIDLKAKKNLTQEKISDLNRVDVSKVPLKDALVLGEKKAKNRIIIFDDPD